MISSGIGPKRSRAERSFLEYHVDRAGSDAAVSRDHEAERQRREENKRRRAQDEREVAALREQRDLLSSQVKKFDSTIRGILAFMSEQLGALEAHPVLEIVGEEYPDILTILDELEASELDRASEQIIQRLGFNTATISRLAHQRGLVMSKAEYAAFHASEIVRGIDSQKELQIEVNGLRATCIRLTDVAYSRNLTIRTLKSAISKLKEQVSNVLRCFSTTLIFLPALPTPQVLRGIRRYFPGTRPLLPAAAATGFSSSPKTRR